MLAILLLFISIPQMLTAGPVNEKGSFPSAKMNEAGDFIIAGNWGALARVKGLYHRLSYPEQNLDKSLHFSTGISHSGKGILCAGPKVYLFENENWQRSLQFNEDKGITGGQSRCAMTAKGNWAVADLASELLFINGSQTSVTLRGQLWLASIGESFVSLSDDGLISIIDLNGTIRSQMQSKLNYLEPTFRFAANARELLIIDSFNSVILTLDTELKRIVKSRTIPLSPIDEGQAAAIHWQLDSWSVAGSWGLWLGLAGEWEKLSPYVSIGDRGAAAFAHSGSQGKFIMLGDDDGDMGALKYLRKAYEISAPRPFTLPRPEPVAESLAQPWWYQAMGFADFQERIDTFPAAKKPSLIAIIDSGADHYQYKDKTRNLWNHNDPINGLDDDGNGLVDDYYGYDFVRDQPYPEDKHGHGSHVFSLASTDPSDRTKTLVIRALDQGGRSNSIDLARAIHYAIDRGSHVLNCSWGGGRPTVALREAFARAEAEGLIVISSAGNDSLNTDKSEPSPNLFPGVLAVGAYDQRGQRARFSNYGKKSVEFMAPGKDIVAPGLGGGDVKMSGTSMAAPLAANAIARLLNIVKARDPNLGQKQAKMQALELACLQSEDRHSMCGKINLFESASL